MFTAMQATNASRNPMPPLRKIFRRITTPRRIILRAVEATVAARISVAATIAAPVADKAPGVPIEVLIEVATVVEIAAVTVGAADAGVVAAADAAVAPAAAQEMARATHLPLTPDRAALFHPPSTPRRKAMAPPIPEASSREILSPKAVTAAEISLAADHSAAAHRAEWNHVVVKVHATVRRPLRTIQSTSPSCFPVNRSQSIGANHRLARHHHRWNPLYSMNALKSTICCRIARSTWRRRLLRGQSPSQPPAHPVLSLRDVSLVACPAGSWRKRA